MSKVLDEKYRLQRKARRYEQKRKKRLAAREMFWEQVSSPQGLHIRF